MHEEGHIIAGHPHKRNLDQELEADSYALKKMSKILVHKALLHIMKVFMNIDWTIAAEFMVRLNDLGYSNSRAYRMGQARNVLECRLLCENSVDERMLAILDRKQKEFEAFADKSVAAENESVELDDSTFGDIIKEEIERINKKYGN